MFTKIAKIFHSAKMMYEIETRTMLLENEKLDYGTLAYLEVYQIYLYIKRSCVILEYKFMSGAITSDTLPRFEDI